MEQFCWGGGSPTHLKPYLTPINPSSVALLPEFPRLVNSIVIHQITQDRNLTLSYI